MTKWKQEEKNATEPKLARDEDIQEAVEVQTGLKDGGPRGNFCVPSGIIYVASWQESRCELEPIWKGFKRHLATEERPSDRGDTHQCSGGIHAHAQNTPRYILYTTSAAVSPRLARLQPGYEIKQSRSG
ncbi:unnamed protein product [Pleuronectes platessa]|uniref:Uncharacterized protein n=1 Tax=Pleuronectes platessa TaxID=8262 RepID=A0A9N7VKM3_PLEPL|nr:unnamed protein product [Pleuronectes platessa]